MDTSRKQPCPSRCRPASAAVTASAAVSPPTVSQTGKPTRSGARLRGAGDAHHAGQALDDLVVGGGLAHRPGLAEAADRAVDQRRVELVQGVPAEAHPGQHAGPEVLDQHVGAR